MYEMDYLLSWKLETICPAIASLYCQWICLVYSFAWN